MELIKMNFAEFEIEFERVKMTIAGTNVALNVIKEDRRYKPMLKIYEEFKKNSNNDDLDEMLEVLLSSKTIKYRS